MENAEHWVSHALVINLGKRTDLCVAETGRRRRAGEGTVPPILEKLIS